MGATDQDWATMWADLLANFDITIPDALNSALVDGVANLAQAKPVLENLTRVVSSLVLIDALNREEQTQKNLITTRIATAKSGYENAHPEEMPIRWEDYSNSEMFAMVQPYDPDGGIPQSIEDTFIFVYSTLNGKVRNGTDKIRNVLKKIIDVEPLF